MNKIILMIVSLTSNDGISLVDYCQVHIDRCSYYITHNLVEDPFEKAYLEGRMDAFQEVLDIIHNKS